MFGYVMINKGDLKVRELETYQSFYCGLCQKLKERYGLSGTDLDGAPFNQLRNYVYSQASIMRLYGVLVTEGPKGVARVTESIVRRA